MTIITDTGWIVGFLDRRDSYHGWARELANEFSPPYFTCESVLSEAHFLLRNVPGATTVLRQLIEEGAFDVSFSYVQHLRRVHALLEKYRDVPMDFADACVVCMAEIHPDSRVLTVDESDFRVYRIRRNKPIAFRHPESVETCLLR